MKKIRKQDHSAVCYQLLTRKLCDPLPLWLLDKIEATVVQKHQATTWVFSRTWQCHKCHSCGVGFESQKKKSGHGCEEKLRPSIM